MKYRFRNRVAGVIIVALLAQTIVPAVASALTGGAVQTEFASYEPPGATDLVNEFTGSFLYNLPVLSVPGPEGSGYALSLAYHSGVSVEEEASWCGYGWSLNAGAILRDKRGLPDDDNGSTVKYWNKVPRNWTASIGPSSTFEAFSVDGLAANVNASIRYNNYMGFGTTVGAGVAYKGVASLGYSLSDGSGAWTLRVNPARLLSELGLLERVVEEHPVDESTKKPMERLATGVERQMVNQYVTFSYGRRIRPTVITAYEGTSVNFKLGVQTTPTILPAGAKEKLIGAYATQHNVPEDGPDPVKGYGYMYTANAGPHHVTDYFREKESGYDTRDMFLSIPFSSPDNFLVTGLGIGGGFRLYNKRPGQFRPNAKTSTTSITQWGAEVHSGTQNVGLGADIGIGSQTLEVGDWPMRTPRTFAGSAERDEPYFFRFNNDPGGKVEFSDGLGVPSAALSWDTVKGWIPDVTTAQVHAAMNGGERSGRSSYIAYRTNREMTETPDPGCDAGLQSGVFYNAYTKSAAARGFVNRTKSGVRDMVGEFAVTAPTGGRYVYGLPVYVRKEKSLQFGLEGLSASAVHHNYIADRAVTPQTADLVVGEERDAPYACMYLLTEVTTPDYVDRTNDGPTPDDFGGYTRFAYRRVAGSDDKENGPSSAWYKWRIPYTGLLYERGALPDPMDDRGGVSAGEREMYLLDTIETKTHFAVFKTSRRDDAYQANPDEAAAAGGTGPTVATATNLSEKLDRIELYVKGSAGAAPRLLQTTRFEYDYSLCRNVPNGVLSGGVRSGKLTLKKVWFEANGVKNARISPYQFGYEYKRSSAYANLSAEAARMYSSAINHASGLSTGAENPDYSPYNTDRWGAYQHDGGSRQAKFQPWVDQTPDTAEFDPAAYHLKWIRLPSGGEIHVQYEQNEYRYVQDRPAMAMVSLKQFPQNELEQNKFYLNVGGDLGIADAGGGGAELQALKRMIRRRFVDGGERMFFKFLFPLQGTAANLTNCVSEYVTGYARVLDVDIDPTKGLYVRLGSGSGAPLPDDICRELFNSRYSGKLRFGQNCDASENGISDDMDVGEIMMALLAKIANTVTVGQLACQSKYIGYEDSYLRVPLTRAKKGGGVRVKRILFYDEAGEDGSSQAMLHGTEYRYRTEDGESSGVACNEPATGREENALVGYLDKRSEQSWVDKVIAGRDLDQFEGPIGESMLPAPSVGYERVVARNIYPGRTNPGFSVSEYFTAKDYPFDCSFEDGNDPARSVAYTPLDPKIDWLPSIPFGPFTYGKSNIWATQGYRFVINGMHGQLKRAATYAGDPSDRTTWALSSSTAYEYFGIGEPVPVMYGVGDVRMEFPGKEEEVVFESRAMLDETNNTRIQADISVGLAGIIPIPFPTAFPEVSLDESDLRTHVTTKVVRFPAIVKRIREFRDGVTTVAQVAGLDPATGTPLLTRTTDGYDSLALKYSNPSHDGARYSYALPAYWTYPAMGPQAVSERTTIATGADVAIQKWYDSAHYLNFQFKAQGIARSTIDRLTSGDLVRLTNLSGAYRGLYHVGRIVGNRVQLLTTSFDIGTYLLPEYVNIEIIRSGRTNQLDATHMEFDTHGQPRTPVDHPMP